MRVIQTIASTRLDHGGTSRSVPQLCDALVAQGVDNYLVTATPADSSIVCNFPVDRARVRTTPENRLFRQWGVSKRFTETLAQLSIPIDQTIIHDHAVWLPTNHAVAKFSHELAIPRIVSPRGMLGEWAMGNGGWKKRIAWWLYQRKDLQQATAFHATSDLEAEEIRRLGLHQPILVAANGLELPENIPSPRGLANKQFLFLSRLHRKKGLLELLNAWRDSAAPRTGWQLKIAGPDDGGFQLEVERRITDLQLAASVSLMGEISGPAKWQLITDSSYFILPSFNENFGIAIAEALACGIPVITTRSTPWKSIAEQKAGWWIDQNHKSLVHTINIATEVAEKLWYDYSIAARKIGGSFRWTEIAKDVTNFYTATLERCSSK